MRSLIFLLLRFTGIPLLLRETVQRHRVSILCYHDPRPQDFERHLRVLLRRYNVISLRRYLAWRRDPTRMLPRKALVLTFDDGHCGNYLLRDLLVRYNVPATIFLCSGIVGTRRHFWWKETRGIDGERFKATSDEARVQTLARSGFTELREYPERQALSAEEIEELRTWVDFQSHTRFHPILPRCSEQRAMEEIRESKIELEQRLGLSIYALAYPNGDYCARDAELARRAGYECALTIDGGYNHARTDCFRLRRLRLSDSADEHEVIVKASGMWVVWERLQKWSRALVATACAREGKKDAKHNIAVG